MHEIVAQITNYLLAFMASYGYIAVFILIFTESFIQPIPPDPFILGATGMGLNLHTTVMVSLVATILGAMVGYFLGNRLGQPIFVKLFGHKILEKGERMLAKWASIGIVICAFTPIPFKAATWLAGMMDMPFVKFIVASVVGRVPRFLLMAYVGERLFS
jgi:membrane protein YqaA with SNARE-associated domain